MQPYERRLRTPARRLRGDLSAAEQRPWRLLRRRQVLGVRVHRQKPLLA
ncbi:DUF559 domain-containing protein [Lysobacter antibioticus]